MEIQTELLSLAGAKRIIEKTAAANSQTEEFIKTCNYEPNNKSKRRLNNIYGIVKRIDSCLINGFIQDIESALRIRNIAMSMVISYMVRYRIVDIDILTTENITLEQIGDEYTKHYHRQQLIVEWIRKFEFVQNAINELANEGKPFMSKNHDEIRSIEEKLDEFEQKLVGASKAMTFAYNTIKRPYEERLQILKQEDFLNGAFTIEDICTKIVLDGKRSSSFSQTDNIFNENSFENLIWFLSKTAQNKLIELIVKSYKSMNEDKISECNIRSN